MTQLVELQKHRAALADAGVEVYAITYDPQDALAKFAEKHGITYQLLSDQGSEVIRRFGILNTLIDPDDPMKHPATGQSFYGIPFPGTYVTDENGVVVEKSFFQEYEKRVSAGTLLDRALGRVLRHDEAPHQETRERMATISAFLSDDALRLDVAATLYLRIAMDDGFHIYGEPLPEGFIPTTVEVGPVEGLEIGDVVYPPTRAREFPQLEVTLPVYDANAIVAVPVTGKQALFAAAAGSRGEGREARAAAHVGPGDATRTVAIPIAVTYQACSETVCHRPRRVEMSLDVPLGNLVLPDFRKN